MNFTFQDIVHNRKNFLIIPKQEIKLDNLFALYALTIGFEALSKNIDTYLNPAIFTDQFLKEKNLSEISITDLNEESRLVVTLSNFDSEIDDILWKKTTHGTEIVINTKEKAPKDVQVGYKQKEYDGVILIGFENISEAILLSPSLKNTISESNSILINNQASANSANNIYGQVNISISQIVYMFMTEFNLPINKDSGTFLVAGIYAGTDNITEKMDLNTYKALADMADLEIDLSKAISLSKFTEDTPKAVTPDAKIDSSIKTPTNVIPKEIREMKTDGEGNIVQKKAKIKTKNIASSTNINLQATGAPIANVPEPKITGTQDRAGDFDPLKKASSFPEPLNFTGEKPKPIMDNTPLPPASNVD